MHDLYIGELYRPGGIFLLLSVSIHVYTVCRGKDLEVTQFVTTVQHVMLQVHIRCYSLRKRKHYYGTSCLMLNSRSIKTVLLIDACLSLYDYSLYVLYYFFNVLCFYSF